MDGPSHIPYPRDSCGTSPDPPRSRVIRPKTNGGLQGNPGPKFPILLKKVVYDGTHTGDWLPVKESPALLWEVDLVLGSSDILTEGEKEFFQTMKRLCEASVATGSPIMF